MKKVIIFLGILVSVLIIRMSASAQNSFEYLSQALLKGIYVAKLYPEYEYAGIGSLYGALLNTGESISLYFDFNSYEDYIISGIADEDVNDLDISIEDGYGYVYTKDNKTDNVPIVSFKPSTSGTKLIRLKNYRSNGASFCVLQILKRGTHNKESTQKLAQALVSCILLAETLSDYTSYVFPSGSFCLFGGCYEESEESGLFNYQVATNGDYYLLAAGSDNISDVDVKIIKQNASGDMSESTIASDAQTNKFSACKSYLYSFNNYYLKLKNYVSDGKGFVFGVVVKEK
ncbi:MAG: hypothetical protein M0R21_09450 [Lentimicrobiaceae bacterium]|nr:hypothetical protein [Lentimicrobiaceae bacterium]